MKKAISLMFALAVMVLVLSACNSESKIPNGRYEPVDSNVALTVQAIIIDGNNFTVDIPFVGGTTVKYSYNSKTGAITVTDGTTGLTNSEYKDGSIWYGGAEFIKTE